MGAAAGGGVEMKGRERKGRAGKRKEGNGRAGKRKEGGFWGEREGFIDYEELAQMIMEAHKSHDLPWASWRPRKTSGISFSPNQKT